MQPVFKIKNVSCERNERWLFKNLNFSIGAGEILQIIGPNGSGKTSLLKLLTGLMPLDEGEILWQQQNIAAHRIEYFNELLYLGHSTGITGALTVTENLNYYTRALGNSRPDTDIQAALSQMGLADYAQLPASSLSAGQQRRIGLARLMLISARLWILDEPLTALDSQGITQVQSLLTKHLQQQGVVILTSHQPLSIANITIKELYL